MNITTEGNIDKLDFTKINNFCLSKDTINRVQKQDRLKEDTCNTHSNDLHPEYIKNSYK